MSILVPFFIGLVIMFFFMIKTKIGPFMSMLLGALIIGIGCGVPANTTINTITRGFGDICASMGIVIIFGTILGEYLEKSNATQSIANKLLKITGSDKADTALASTGFLVSIPVFCDVALLMLAPIVKAVALKSKQSLGPLAVILSLSLLVTNTYVAPTPPPLAIVAILGIDIGVSILWGLFTAVFVVLACWAYCHFYLKKQPESYWVKSDVAPKDNIKEVDECNLPGFMQAVMPILVPISLILLDTTFKMLLPKGSGILKFSSVLGDKNIALVFGILTAIVLLKKTLPKGELYTAMTNALTIAGPIIFITAAGGALAKVIDATGTGPIFAKALADSSFSIILIPFFICGFSKFVQGSAAVACIMASTLTLPLCNAGLIDPIVAFIAICAGSGFGSNVNNSYFWVFANIFGYDTKTSLKTLCLGQHVMAFAGLIVAFGISFFR